MNEVWTPTKMLSWTAGYLERHGDEHPRLSAEWLLSSVTGLTRVELYTNYDRPLSLDELDAMRSAVRRRADGEPLQYVTGEMPFRHIVVRCEPGVLIPRPETEVLVDVVLSVLEDISAPRVLELGVGTGCICCSIAMECDGARVIATDISPDAVALARRNVEALHVDDRIELIECDLAAALPQELHHSFDVIVSNPPYIPTDIIDDLPEEVVGFEPHLALDGGLDGLDVFRRIVSLAPRMLRPGGSMVVELGEYNVLDAADMLRVSGAWSTVDVRDDLTHRPRVLSATWKG